MAQNIFQIRNINSTNSISFVQHKNSQLSFGGYGPIGDFNGDNIPDFTVNGDGRQYIVFGSKSLPPIIDLAALNSSTGLDLNTGGSSINFLKDVDGDGKDDIYVINSGVNGNGVYYRGMIYFGTNGTVIDRSALQTLVGSSEQENICVAQVKNFTGNNVTYYANICEQVPYVSLTPNATISSANSVVINLYQAADNFLISLSDFNGDGLGDFMVRSGMFRVPTVIFGNRNFSTQLDTAKLNGQNGFVISDIAINVQAVPKNFGDFDGNGLKDLIFCGIQSSSVKYALYVLFGTRTVMPASIDSSYLNGITGFTIVSFEIGSGNLYFDFLSDITGDGMDEIMISAPSYPCDSANHCGFRGAIFIIYGSSNMPAILDLGSLDSSKGFVIVGDFGKFSGLNLAMSLGDVNQDNKQDILLQVEDSTVGIDRAIVLFIEKIAASLGYGPTTTTTTTSTSTTTSTTTTTTTITLTTATKTTNSAFFSTVSHNVSVSGNATEDPSNNSDNNARSGLSIAEMAGIAIGALVFVVAAGYLIYKKFHMNHNKVLDSPNVGMHDNPIHEKELEQWNPNNYAIRNEHIEYVPVVGQSEDTTVALDSSMYV